MCAQVMSEERLRRQSKAALEILNAILGKNVFWREEPVVGMWYGYEWSLMKLGIALCNRIYHTTKDEEILDERQDFISAIRFARRTHKFQIHTDREPGWLGNDDFHDSHKATLLRLSKKSWMSGGDSENWPLIKNLGWKVDETKPPLLPEIDARSVQERTVNMQPFIPMDVGRGKRLMRTRGGAV